MLLASVMLELESICSMKDEQRTFLDWKDVFTQFNLLRREFECMIQFVDPAEVCDDGDRWFIQSPAQYFFESVCPFRNSSQVKYLRFVCGTFAAFHPWVSLTLCRRLCRCKVLVCVPARRLRTSTTEGGKKPTRSVPRWVSWMWPFQRPSECCSKTWHQQIKSKCSCHRKQHQPHYDLKSH